MARTGLKRLSCPSECEGYGERVFGAYLTVAQIEHGMRPVCPSCGLGLIPDDPELWGSVPQSELERHPLWAEYGRELASVEHGQMSHVQRGRQVRAAATVATERIMRTVRDEARARQLAGIVRAPEPVALPF